MQDNLDASYWDNRYQQQQTQWDIGDISTPLKEYFDQIHNKEIRILIPGCGNSYEAAYLLDHGFKNITLVDLSPVLTQQLRDRFSKELDHRLRIITGNFFELEGQWDLIVEQTFFCALDPGLRKSYVQKMYELLSPGGKIAGVLFNRVFEGGPPFGGSVSEYQNLFSPLFDLHTLSACYNSIKPRQGSEVFLIASKKAG